MISCPRHVLASVLLFCLTATALVRPAPASATESLQELSQQCVRHREEADYTSGLPICQRVLELAESQYGPNSLDTAYALIHLGQLLRAQGEYARALPLNERALAIYEMELGPEDPDTSIARGHLAALLGDMGDNARALPLFERALAIYEMEFGPEARDTSTALNNLGALLNLMGEHDRALPLLERALAIREKTLGPEHPDTAFTLFNLANLLISRGEYAGALPLCERSLAIHERSRGPEHPETASALTCLANLRRLMGEYARALPLSERALAIYETKFGPNHRSTAISLNSLANILVDMGDYARALVLCERALAIDEKVFGADHVATASDRNELAMTLARAGSAERALPLLQQALDSRRRKLASDHPVIGKNLNNIAEVLSLLGRHNEAADAALQGLRIREKRLGPEHPIVAASLRNLARAQLALGQLDKAEQSIGRALAMVTLRDLRGELRSEIPALYAEWLAASGDRRAAIVWAKRAVNAVQEERGTMASLPRELRTSFLQSRTPIFRRLAGWLIDEGRVLEAQQVLAMLKDEEYLEFIRSPGVPETSARTAPFTDLEEDAWGPYLSLAKDLVPLFEEQGRLERRVREGIPLTQAEQQRRVELGNRLEQPREAFNQFLGDLRKRLSKDAVKTEQTQSIGEKIDGHGNLLRAWIDAGQPETALLQFVVLEDRIISLFSRYQDIPPVVHEARWPGTDKRISRKDLSSLVNAFRAGLASSTGNPWDSGRTLYDALIGPLRKTGALEGVRTLALIPDDTLRYIPFAALWDGKRYLIEDVALAIHTRASESTGRLGDAPTVKDWYLGALGMSLAHYTPQGDTFNALTNVPGNSSK